MRHGTGTYVSSLEPELLVRPLTFVLSLSEHASDQLFEARKVVEPAMAALAAERIDDGTLDLLEACVERAARRSATPRRSWRPTSSCTTRSAWPPENAVLGRFMESIRALGLASRRRTGSRRAVQEQTVEDHRAIVAALRAHDPDAASAAMLHHLDNVERNARKEER